MQLAGIKMGRLKHASPRHSGGGSHFTGACKRVALLPQLAHCWSVPIEANAGLPKAQRDQGWGHAAGAELRLRATRG